MAAMNWINFDTISRIHFVVSCKQTGANLMAIINSKVKPFATQAYLNGKFVPVTDAEELAVLLELLRSGSG